MVPTSDTPKDHPAESDRTTDTEDQTVDRAGRHDDLTESEQTDWSDGGVEKHDPETGKPVRTETGTPMTGGENISPIRETGTPMTGGEKTPVRTEPGTPMVGGETKTSERRTEEEFSRSETATDQAGDTDVEHSDEDKQGVDNEYAENGQ